jgi:uncharacterized membrane protein
MNQSLSKIFLVIGSIYLYILLWLSLQSGLRNFRSGEIDGYSLAVFIALTIYTIIGIVSYFYGFQKNKKDLLLYGGSLIGFVVFRLLTVEIWQMQLTGRIITFFLIGILLIISSTTFLSKNKKNNQSNQ